jgi:hypothetical protein
VNREEIETTELLLAELTYFGLLEPSGMEEDGEMLFKPTEQGRYYLDQLRTCSIRVKRD